MAPPRSPPAALLDDPQLSAVRDTVATAQRAVDYWRRKVARHRASEPPPGLVERTLQTLFGGAPPPPDLRALEADQQRLVAAERTLTEAVNALKAEEEALKADRDRRLAFEEAASALRASDHPQAPRLRLVEEELGELRSELGPLSVAIHAGDTLMTTVDAASQEVEEAMAWKTPVTTQPLAVGGLPPELEASVKERLVQLPPQVDAFDDARLALDQEVTLDGYSEGHSRLLGRHPWLLELAPDAPMQTSILTHIGEWSTRLEAFGPQVRRLLDPLRHQLDLARQRINHLEGERHRLVEGAHED